MGPALDALLERSHDFTDSPYTSHEHRQRILILLDSLAERVSHLIEAVSFETIPKIHQALSFFLFGCSMKCVHQILMLMLIQY